jgi:flavin-binding protein dodecin
MLENHTYKKIEVIGSSPNSIEDAIKNALAECKKSLHDLEWFEMVDTRGHIVNGDVAHYQVTLKVGMRIRSDH